MFKQKPYLLTFPASALMLVCFACHTMAQNQPVLKGIVQFNGTNGSDAVSDLIQLPNGNFLGVTLAPPPLPKAPSTIYELKAGGNIQTLYRLAADGSQGVLRGNTFANDGVIQASDGKIYGIMNQGGSIGFGLVYRFTPPGTFETLYNFQLADGSPVGKLVQALDGNLYGVTTYGGANGVGDIFRIGLDGHYSIVYSFSGTDGPGAWPFSGLAAHPNGQLYGSLFLSQPGGSTIFQFDPTSGEAELLAPGPVSTTTPPVIGGDGGLYFLATPAPSCVGCSGSLVRYETDGTGPQVKYNFLASQVYSTDSLMLEANDGSFIGGCRSPSLIYEVCQVNPASQTLTLLPLPVGTGTTIVGGFVEGANGNLIAAVPTTTQSLRLGALLGLFPALPKPAPSVIGFFPATASVGETVTLLGSYFVGSTGVSINGHSATFTVKGSGAAQFVVPPDATSGQVSIFNQGGSAVSVRSLIIQ